MGKKFAFTLAEVLITLAIIGIVAALTIPSLVNEYQKKQTAVTLTKVYATLWQAIKMSEIDNGPLENWYIFKPLAQEDAIEYSKKFAEYILPYLKGAELKYSLYAKNTLYGASPDAVKNLKGDNENAPASRYYIITADNKIISFGHVNWLNIYPFIQVDINGTLKPNTMGKDIFIFALKRNDNGVRELAGYNYYGLSKDEILKNKCCRTCSGQNAECSVVIIEDDWKISDDYPW